MLINNVEIRSRLSPEITEIITNQNPTNPVSASSLSQVLPALNLNKYKNVWHQFGFIQLSSHCFTFFKSDSVLCNLHFQCREVKKNTPCDLKQYQLQHSAIVLLPHLLRLLAWLGEKLRVKLFNIHILATRSVGQLCFLLLLFVGDLS